MLPVKGFILAAGYGRRLWPLTSLLPKPLLPCMGVPVIELALAQLRRHGLVELAINTHYLPQTFSYLTDRLTIFHERQLLGSAGFLTAIGKWLGDNDLLVYNGDIVSNLDFTALYNIHRANNATLTLALLKNPVPQMRRFTVNGDEIVNFGSVGTHGFACAQILSPAFVRLVCQNNFAEITDAYRAVIGRDKVCAYIHDGLWFDIGNGKDFFLAHQALHRQLNNDQTFMGIADLVSLYLADDYATLDVSCLSRVRLVNSFIMSSQVTVRNQLQLVNCVVLGKTTLTADCQNQIIFDDLQLKFSNPLLMADNLVTRKS